MAAAEGPAVWRARAREFADSVLIPSAAEADRLDRPPADLRSRLAAVGFLGLGIPSEYGGRPEDARTVAAVLEELARGSAAAATLVAVHLSVCALPIVRWGTPSQKEHYLPNLSSGRSLGAFALTEPEAGSDAASLRTSFRSDGDGFVLEGTKTFITNAEVADVILTFAASAGPPPRPISAFLVPRGTPGLRAPPSFDKLGLRGSPTGQLVYEELRLPSESRLGEEGRGLSIALGALTVGRIGIAACALGTAQAAFDLLRFEASEDPSEAVRSTVARAFTRLAAARALVASAAALRDAEEPFIEAASAAKLVASEAAVWIAERAVDLGGPAAVRSGHPAERLLRDARVFPIVEGTTEIQELILGRDLLPRRSPPALGEGP